MSVIPSCCSKAQSFPGTSIYGPVMMADLMQVPVVAAQMPQGYLKYEDQTLCFSVEGPDKCHDLAAWTYEYLDDCSIVYDECDALHKRTATNDEDHGTDNVDDHGDSAMESQEDVEADDHDDSFMDSKDNEYDSSEDSSSKVSSAEGYFEDASEDASEELKEDEGVDSNQYGSEENKKHDDSEYSTLGDIIDSFKDHFEDSEEQDHEDTKEHDFEDADEPDSKDQEYGSVSSEPDFGYSSSTPAFGYSSSTPDFGYSASTPDFSYSSSTPVDEGYDYLPVVTKAFKVARQLSSGIPQSVQDALISDPNAPRSLAAQFTDGADTPDWYDSLPEQQQELFLTGRAEASTTTMTLTTQGATTMTLTTSGQTMTTTMTTQGAATTVVTPAPTTTGFGYRGYSDPVCDNPSGNVTQSCIELAVSSQAADHYSNIATDMFSAASSLSCSALSSAASTVSEDAASASARASAARSSLSCDNIEGNTTNVNKDAVGVAAASPAVSVPKSSAVFAVSLTVAVATLGLALYL